MPALQQATSKGKEPLRETSVEIHCNQPTNNELIHCEPCRIKLLNKRIALKVETFNAYGGCFCKCCGEPRAEFLTLEHPDNDGKAHRKAFGVNGNGFYRRLRLLGFPQEPRLEVNCMNCNFAKKQGGRCPHEVEREQQARQLAENQAGAT